MRAGHRLGLLRRERPAELFVLPELRKKGCDRMTETIPALLLVACAMALVIAICFWLRGEAARDRKMRSTPPCDTCEHYKLSSSFSFAYAEHLCACPRVVERNAREIGLSRPSLIGDIRGTKLCEFEPKEEGE